MSKGTKIVVKDYLDGDEFDLSLQSLTSSTLPVKEIVSTETLFRCQYSQVTLFGVAATHSSCLLWVYGDLFSLS